MSEIVFYTTAILAVGFFLNLLWEVRHSVLYTTCHTMPLSEYAALITKMSLKDGVWISCFYLMSVALFQNLYITENLMQLAFFVVLGLLFAFIDERISLAMGRWEYGPKMPLTFGVGITPLLEIAVTGVATFALVFNLL